MCVHCLTMLQPQSLPYRSRPPDTLTPLSPQKATHIPEFGMDYGHHHHTNNYQPPRSTQVHESKVSAKSPALIYKEINVHFMQDF